MNRNTKRFMRAADPSHVSECMAKILKLRARVEQCDFAARVEEWWYFSSDPEMCDGSCSFCQERAVCRFCESHECLLTEGLFCPVRSYSSPPLKVSLQELAA